MILREPVLTRLVNKAILSGDAFISKDGQILLSDDDEEVKRRNK